MWLWIYVPWESVGRQLRVSFGADRLASGGLVGLNRDEAIEAYSVNERDALKGIVTVAGNCGVLATLGRQITAFPDWGVTKVSINGHIDSMWYRLATTGVGTGRIVGKAAQSLTWQAAAGPGDNLQITALGFEWRSTTQWRAPVWLIAASAGVWLGGVSVWWRWRRRKRRVVRD
jgi:hypothetical protein